MARQPADHRRRRHRLSRHARILETESAAGQEKSRVTRQRDQTQAQHRNEAPNAARKRRGLAVRQARRHRCGSQRNARRRLPTRSPAAPVRPPTQPPPPTPSENPKTGENSGPDDPTLSPNSLPTTNARTMPPQASQAKAKPTKDAGVFLTDYQITPNPTTKRHPAPAAAEPADGYDGPAPARLTAFRQTGVPLPIRHLIRPNPSRTSRTSPAPTSKTRRSAWTQCRASSKTSPNRSTPGRIKPPRNFAR